MSCARHTSGPRRDYSHPPDLSALAGPARLLDAVAAERLRGELRDVLPGLELERYDPSSAVGKGLDLYRELMG
jgi:hypothetical protein